VLTAKRAAHGRRFPAPVCRFWAPGHAMLLALLQRSGASLATARQWRASAAKNFAVAGRRRAGVQHRLSAKDAHQPRLPDEVGRRDQDQESLLRLAVGGPSLRLPGLGKDIDRQLAFCNIPKASKTKCGPKV
jgi:hypothetical protein